MEKAQEIAPEAIVAEAIVAEAKEAAKEAPLGSARSCAS